MCTGHRIPPFASYGGTQLGPTSEKEQNYFWELHSRKCNSPRETKLSPNASLLRQAALSGFCPSPLLAIRTRRLWAASCSLCTGALQVIARAGNQLQSALLQGEGGWGLKRPCVHWPKHPTFCQLGRNPARAHFRKGTKLTSGSCFREVTLSSGNQAQPQCVFAHESRAFSFVPWVCACPRAKEGLGCLLLPGHWCCDGGRWSWKPTPNVLSFGEKACGA